MQTVSDSVLPVNSSTVGVPLVTSPISQESPKASSGCCPSDSVLAFEVYPASVKVLRPPASHLKDNVAPDRSGSALAGFSSKSKSRLRFLAANSADHISSQFCLTYADDFPDDGATCKKHLNLFLTALRYDFPDLMYIWIGEFQTRGAPHFHIFLNLPVTDANQTIMADHWHRIAGVSQEKHKRFHNHPKNFIPWTMGNGSYLCKYLDKDHQKQIPDSFTSFGRWWGNSRNIKPVPVVVDPFELDFMNSDSVDTSTGEVRSEKLTKSAPQFLIRTLVKYQNKQYNCRPWAVKRSQSMTVLMGASVFWQSLNYLHGVKK